jgi:transcriptional regulator GlxA family with amidase domain
LSLSPRTLESPAVTPNPASAPDRADHRPGTALTSSRGRIHRVLDYIDQHANEPLTTADLTQVAGVSARGLQDGFQKQVGMSPMAYVRNARLERAHADLLANPTSMSVTDVAMRWGFFHLSRFAGQYRRRFGVLPSTTVKRAIAQTSSPARERRLVG